jgi:single-stranded DNA-binding protein
MIDPKNVITITGGIVADPELVVEKIAKFRVAVDYAGSEKGSQNNSGYFDVVYYLKDGNEFASKNASFVYSQITAKNLKKGSGIHIVGRLVQERWKQDDQNRSKVVIVAESISYVSSGQKSGGKTISDASSVSESNSVPEEF